jgi:ABC-type Fe3+-hydroxamate transport system substrate-binding protein
VTDQMGRSLTLEALPQRVISLCPSLTETLVDYGLGERLVGRTRFCIHPKEALRAVQNVGGTKEVDFERIRKLQPDLIIGEKEENTAAMIAALEQEWPVFMTDVRDLESAEQMMYDLGEITGTEVRANEIAGKVQASWSKVEPLAQPVSCLYLIWKNPWMAVGADTFIDSVLKKCGFDNVGAELEGRYPVLEDINFVKKNPKIVLLSTEPFPFKAEHMAEVQSIVPSSLVKIVDGEAFSWYGSHQVGVENYLNLLLHGTSAWLSLQD